MSTYQIHTFGCKVNTYDSGLLQKRLEAEGFHPEALVHVLNTCAVTSEASKEAVRLSRRIKAKQPFAKVVVTGCAAQVDTELFENIPSVDLVIANSHKGSLPFLIQEHLRNPAHGKVFKSRIFAKTDLEPGGGVELSHTRSFLKIQDGCDSFCSFCIIPYARGRSRSLAIADLVQRCQQLEDEGVREVVLTGVHIGDYQDPSTGLRLEDLVQALLKRTRELRFRLTSLEPIEINKRILELYQSPRMQPHFHLSLQSCESRVLGAMKRKYGEKEVRWALEEVHRSHPHAYVGLDVIAGFPSETDEEFETTYRVLSETPWTRMHVFPYSERKGTKALTLEPVPQNVRVARARRLRELSASRWKTRADSQVGALKTALVLADGNRGLSTDYWNLQLSETVPRGNWVQVRVLAVVDGQESLRADVVPH